MTKLYLEPSQILSLRHMASQGEKLAQLSQRLEEKLCREILEFSKHAASPYEIRSACICGYYPLGLSGATAPVEVLLIIRDFQPRLMNYLKVLGKRIVIVIAVDQWVFERDVDRGFLGEAVAGGLILPYSALVDEDYLHRQEVKLKGRLVSELLQSLVLEFPELSHEFHIEPEYFMYETLLRRSRLFPPLTRRVLAFLQENKKNENVRQALQGYLEALKELERKKAVYFSNGYVRIDSEFADKARSRKARFVNLFRPAQKTLFNSLLGSFPEILGAVSQSREALLRFRKSVPPAPANSASVQQLENPQKYVHVPTATGMVSLASRMNLEAFARRMLGAAKDARVEIKDVGGVLNDVYLIRVSANGQERKVVAKSFKDWSNFKWFPLTLWTVGTRTFAVSGQARLERECAINQTLYKKGFAVPRLLHVSHAERLVFMEYVEGENLEKIVRKVAKSRSAEKLEKELAIIGRAGEVFARVHSGDIALGDTKPENMVVGNDGEICLLDLEQASRRGDKVWDVAEFLYYAGHYIPPFVGTRSTELLTKAFINGYLRAGGNVAVVKKAGYPKYTKVFSVFTLPHIMFAMSSLCRKADQLKG